MKWHQGAFSTKEEKMGKESKNRREEKKKPQLSLKERRAKKLEKRMNKQSHNIETHFEGVIE